VQTSHISTAPPLVEPELGIWFDGRAYHYQHQSAMYTGNLINKSHQVWCRRQKRCANGNCEGFSTEATSAQVVFESGNP
jgi:hypothetical protein